MQSLKLPKCPQTAQQCSLSLVSVTSILTEFRKRFRHCNAPPAWHQKITLSSRSWDIVWRWSDKRTLPSITCAKAPVSIRVMDQCGNTSDWLTKRKAFTGTRCGHTKKLPSSCPAPAIHGNI